jgi:hypothetical protein
MGDEIWSTVPEAALRIPILFPPDELTLGLAYLTHVEGLKLAGDKMFWLAEVDDIVD